MKKLVKLSKRKEDYIGSIPFYFNKRIAILVIVTITMLVSTINVSAVRKVVSQFISFVYEKYTEIRFDSSNSIKGGKFIPLLPSYIPEGFTVSKEDLDGSVCTGIIKL